MKEVFQMLNSEVRNLEENLVKLDALLAFINSDGVKEDMDEENHALIEKLTNSIKTDYKVIEQKTFELTQEATFEDFVFMKTNAASINSSKAKIYEIIGPCMVQALESRVF
jgi:GTPase involved in cell partitioning and DNA repair